MSRDDVRSAVAVLQGSCRDAALATAPTCHAPRRRGIQQSPTSAITGSPAFAGDDGRGPKRRRAFWRNEPEVVIADKTAAWRPIRLARRRALWFRAGTREPFGAATPVRRS